MKSFTLAVVAAIAALCQADSFAIPNPWNINDLTISEPERRAIGIGGHWKYNIVDETPGPQWFNTTCHENFHYYRVLGESDQDTLGVSRCEDKSVRWTVRSKGPDCAEINIFHGYACESGDDGVCFDQVDFPFCVDDYLTETKMTTTPHEGRSQLLSQTRPMIMFPLRDVASKTNVTV